MHNQKQKIRIGILGAGAVTKDLHLPVLLNMPEVEIIWICDKDATRARQLSKQYKIPLVYDNLELCSDVDIVLVAIPVGYRTEVMQHILSRGWHAFCEKPFALSLTEHDQYLSVARQKNLQLGVALVRRYGAATIMAKKMVEGRHLGPIVAAWANEGRRMKRTGHGSDWYFTDPKAGGGGVLTETGSHLVDQLFTIINASSFKLDQCTQRRFKGIDFDTKFIGSISTEQQQDIKCTFELSLLEDLCNGVFIQFSDFILKCGLFFEDSLDMLSNDGTFIARFDTNEGPKTIAQAFYLEWKDFLNQCTSGMPSFISADTSRQSTAIIEQCYRNAQIIDVSENINEVLHNV